MESKNIIKLKEQRKLITIIDTISASITMLILFLYWQEFEVFISKTDSKEIHQSSFYNHILRTSMILLSIVVSIFTTKLTLFRRPDLLPLQV